LPFPPRATPSPPPFPGGKSAIHGAILPTNQASLFCYTENLRLHRGQGAIRLPPLQPAMRGALRPPLGAVRDITPAATRNQDVHKVFRIFRNGAWGIPRLRFGGAGGKTSSNKRHSKSLTPSNRPAILPSYVQIEQYSTKIILVGYIHLQAPQRTVIEREFILSEKDFFHYSIFLFFLKKFIVSVLENGVMVI
jgi:hypothetical protein